MGATVHSASSRRGDLRFGGAVGAPSTVGGPNADQPDPRTGDEEHRLVRRGGGRPNSRSSRHPGRGYPLPTEGRLREARCPQPGHCDYRGQRLGRAHSQLTGPTVGRTVPPRPAGPDRSPHLSHRDTVAGPQGEACRLRRNDRGCWLPAATPVPFPTATEPSFVGLAACACTGGRALEAGTAPPAPPQTHRIAGRAWRGATGPARFSTATHSGRATCSLA